MQSDQSNRNKSIAICSSEFPPGPGGIGAHAYQLASFLIAQRFSVIVYAPSRKKYDSEKFDLSSPFIVRRYQANRNFLYKVFSSISFLFSLRKQISWVILSGSNQLFLTLLIRVFFTRKILAVIHGHEILMVGSVQKKILLYALQSVNVIVAVSEFARNKLVSAGLKKDVIIIPNGVSYKGFEANSHSTQSSSDNTLILVTVGSITSRKGQHNVLKCIPALLSVFKKVEYHLIGMEPEKQAIDNLAMKLQISDHLRFHGVVSDVEKTRLLANSDIFMMLSENQPNGDVEGFGIAILEANQLGIPSIGSKNTGVEQAIHNGISGLLVDASNVQEIVNAVVGIKNNYQKYVAGSIQWAKKHDWQEVGELYIQVLNS